MARHGENVRITAQRCKPARLAAYWPYPAAELAADPAAPAIIRASAATLAQPYANASTLLAVRALLQDKDPSVRIAALGMLVTADTPNRVLSASPLLADPIRGVRIEAVHHGEPAGQSIPESRRVARRSALQEYEAVLAQEADLAIVRCQPGQPAFASGT